MTAHAMLTNKELLREHAHGTTLLATHFLSPSHFPRAAGLAQPRAPPEKQIRKLRHMPLHTVTYRPHTGARGPLREAIPQADPDAYRRGQGGARAGGDGQDAPRRAGASPSPTTQLLKLHPPSPSTTITTTTYHYHRRRRSRHHPLSKPRDTTLTLTLKPRGVGGDQEMDAAQGARADART